jgi:hypothetical protein
MWILQSNSKGVGHGREQQARRPAWGGWQHCMPTAAALHCRAKRNDQQLGSKAEIWLPVFGRDSAGVNMGQHWHKSNGYRRLSRMAAPGTTAIHLHH